MYRNENVRKIVQIFIVAFLCSEMESSRSHRHAYASRSATYLSGFNDTAALPANAKHQASIRLAARDGVFGEGHMCSGALVAPSVVLTVAQCLHDYDNGRPRHPAEVKVVLGALNRYQRDAHTLSYGATHIFRPVTFDPRTLTDNIAILMLERDVPAGGAAVQPIAWRAHEASTQRRTNDDVSAGYEVNSWANTAAGVPLAQLVSFNVTHSTDAACAAQHGTSIEDGFICMRFSNDSTAFKRQLCARDAGATLLLDNQLLGLAAIQPCECGGECGCAAAIRFTSVAHHSQWIADRIGDGKNLNSAIWGNLGFLLFTAFALKASRPAKFLWSSVELGEGIMGQRWLLCDLN